MATHFGRLLGLQLPALPIWLQHFLPLTSSLEHPGRQQAQSTRCGLSATPPLRLQLRQLIGAQSTKRHDLHGSKPTLAKRTLSNRMPKPRLHLSSSSSKLKQDLQGQSTMTNHACLPSAKSLQFHAATPLSRILPPHKPHSLPTLHLHLQQTARTQTANGCIHQQNSSTMR